MNTIKTKFHLIIFLIIIIVILIISSYLLKISHFDRMISKNEYAENSLVVETEKLPYQYSYDEFLLLNEEDKARFINWFATQDDFLQWEKHQTVLKENKNLPWTNGGKLPSQYSYVEFEALSSNEKQEFYSWFISHDTYMNWESMSNDIVSNGVYPWENGGKKPNQYTYLEFEKLSLNQKEAFYDWFLSHEDYLEWESNAE